MKDTILSLVLPVYNAETRLIPVIEECFATLPRYFSDYEIIIVDDNSSDTTSVIADNLAAHHEPIMVIHHARKLGYGGALLNGCRAARGDYVLTMDITGRIPVNEMAQLLPYMGRYDIVTGYCDTARSSRLRDTLVNRIANRLFQLDLYDIGSHFSLIRADLLEELGVKSPTALVAVEMIARARQQGRTYIQVCIDAHASTETVEERIYAGLGAGSLWDMFWLQRHVDTAVAADVEVAQYPRSLWIQRVVLATVLFVVLRGLWLLLRRRIIT